MVKVASMAGNSCLPRPAWGVAKAVATDTKLQCEQNDPHSPACPPASCVCLGNVSVCTLRCPLPPPPLLSMPQHVLTIDHALQFSAYALLADLGAQGVSHLWVHQQYGEKGS